MTKGTKWTQQSYKVDTTFPYEWIKKKWRENFHVTSIGTAGSPSTKQQWAVVMSRDTEFRHQVVEIDFQYPSEGIHYHWDKGAPRCWTHRSRSLHFLFSWTNRGKSTHQGMSHQSSFCHHLPCFLVPTLPNLSRNVMLRNMHITLDVRWLQRSACFLQDFVVPLTSLLLALAPHGSKPGIAACDISGTSPGLGALCLACAVRGCSL